jgi:SSS family solute:Na+ symporter
VSSPIIYAFIYFAIVVFGSFFYFRGRVKNMDDFTKGGQTLSWVMVSCGLALIPLGSGHTMSLWEASAGLGASVLFWPVIVGGVFLPLLMLWFGPWIRDLGVNTFPEALEKLYGKKMGYLHGCVSVASWTGISMGETLAAGGAIYGLTGGAVPYFPWCIVIAFILIMVYVIFGGILQYSMVSVVNATVMIVGSYIAMFLVGGWLTAHAAGWEGITNFYSKANELWKLEMFRFSPQLFFEIIIPVSVLHITAAAVTQGMYIPLLSAKSNQECRKGVFLAAFINGLSSFPWVIMALIAMTIPAIAAGGAKLSVINLAIKTLPPPIVGLLMICLLAATLSTGSSVMLGNATIICDVILKRACFPKMSGETQLKAIRPIIIICGLMACVPALFVPMIFPVFLWCFSFGIPIFVIWIIGMLWKTSNTAAWITVLVTYLVNFIWTFATPSWAPQPFDLNMYPVTVCSVVLGVGLNLFLPGDTGLLRKVRAMQIAG